MNEQGNSIERLSPWWRCFVFLVVATGFAILIGIAIVTPGTAPPIPLKVLDPSGYTIFIRQDIISGQQVFLRYGLMTISRGCLD